jgi:hypothetical protein
LQRLRWLGGAGARLMAAAGLSVVFAACVVRTERAARRGSPSIVLGRRNATSPQTVAGSIRTVHSAAVARRRGRATMALGTRK